MISFVFFGHSNYDTMAEVIDIKNIQDQTINSVAPIGEPMRRRPWWKLGGGDYPFVSVDAGYSSPFQNSPSSSQSTLPIPDKAHNVWEAAEAVDIYKPIEGYEGAHRFDPSYHWTAAEEKALVRTVRVPSSFVATITDRIAARLAYRPTSMCNVLCTSARQRQYHPSRRWQHVKYETVPPSFCRSSDRH